MKSQAISNISDTARWIAAYRAMETDRPDALFKDPLAKLLAGEQGEEIVRTLPGGKATAWALIVRTRVIDELIAKVLASGEVGTVLNLAAGLDTRPYRLELPSELRWIEVDLPGLIAEKNERLKGHEPVCRLERISVDLLDQKARRAYFEKVAGEAKGETLVITEGILMYLDEPQVMGLADDLGIFQYWIQDYFSPALLKLLRASWGGVLRAGNSELRFASRKGARFYEPQGWKVVEDRDVLEESKRLGRRMPLGSLVYPWIPAYRRVRMHYPACGFALLGRQSAS